MIGTFQLRGMEFLGHHGCFEEERIIGARFRVDLIYKCEIASVAVKDDVKEAVDYREVYLKIKEVMKTSVNTIERLSYNILDMLKKEYPQILAAELQITKLNPALGGQLSGVSVKVSYSSFNPKLMKSIEI